jgi:hypothetical protein
VGGYKFLFLFFGLLVVCTVLQQIYLKESRGVPLEEMAACVLLRKPYVKPLIRLSAFGATSTFTRH